jgi:hypothetical protein
MPARAGTFPEVANTILDGLGLVDSTGLAILATILLSFCLAVAASLRLRARYSALERDLERNGGVDPAFDHPVLDHVVRAAREAARRADEPNTQAIVEERFQAELGTLLLGERFVKAATGLVIILGLLGTFYGLTLSIGKIVHLVAVETAAGTDVVQGVSTGLTQALSGMAVAFSNSLVGIVSAVILTVLGVVCNPTDRRVALMVRIETLLDRVVALERGARGDTPAERAVAGFGDTVSRLEGVVARFESALQAFATSTRDFREFNAHLKDNVQRMSLSFGDLSDTLKSQIGALKNGSQGS